MKVNYRVLVVDDDFKFHANLRLALGDSYEFDGARDEQELKKKLSSGNSFDLILLDLDLHGNEDVTVGLNLLPYLNQNFPDIPIIVITKEGKISVVMEAMNNGAKIYLHKKELDYKLWDKQFRTIIENKDLKKENTKLKREKETLESKISQNYIFIGESDKILEIKRKLKILSEEYPDSTILITGETGVGKEVAARYLHQQGVRKQAAFVGVNLAAIPKEMLESELFGHKKGSFTNAEYDREGYFRQANHGVLLLDEIGDVGANIQIKLLRFLETRLIRPIGWDQDVALDVQIVTATHRNLQEEIKKGNFREDLYQRLKAMVIYIPALRERREDIPLIIRHYLGQLSHDAAIIPPAVMNMLLNYDWPGNIRELVNTINSMMMTRKILDRVEIAPDCLPKEIQEFIPGASPSGTGTTVAQFFDLKNDERTIEEQKAIVELTRIEDALKKHPGSGAKKHVAAELGYDKSGKSDNLNYKITSIYKQYPHLFSAFPNISVAYKKYVQ
ncbi:MAG: sigma-54-dependent transcriptional regulator [Saprospiraceae bacterium]